MTSLRRRVNRAGLASAAAAIAALGAAPARAQQSSVVATVSHEIGVDEERLYVSEVITILPQAGAPARLAPSERRFVLADAAGDGAKAMVVTDPRVEPLQVGIQDRVVEIPDFVPASGLRVGLNYSVPARSEVAEYTVRYPIPVAEVRAGARGEAPGFRLSISVDEISGPASRPRGPTWTAMAARAALIAPGAPVRIRVSGLRTYHPPAYAKVALALSVLIVLGGLLLRSRRDP